MITLHPLTMKHITKSSLHMKMRKPGSGISSLPKMGNNINNWGVLQFFDTLKDPAQGKAKADALLALYNRKTRKLQIKGAFGDVRVRAGSAVIVKLNLGDIVIGSYMMVEKVRHIFNESIHQMDLTLRGTNFI